MFSKIIKLTNSKKITGFLLVAVCVVALLVINALGSSLSLKLDLSRGKAYTLSSGSKNFLQKLNKEVEVIFFVSDSLPSKYTPLKAEVVDLLKEIKFASSKVSYKLVDPKKSQDATKLAQDFGVRQFEFPQTDNDQFSVSSGYFSMGLRYNGQTDSIDNIDLQNFEYLLLSKIYKLGTKSLPKVGFLSNFPVVSYSQGQQAAPSFEALKTILGTQFEVMLVDGASEISSDVKALIAVEDTPLSPENADFVRGYLKKGGKALFFTDAVKVDTLIGATSSGKLLDIARDYGLNVNNDLILSAQSGIVNFQTSDGQRAIAQYPYWYIAQTFANESNYFYNVPSLVFPWGSSISVSKKPGITSGALVKSSPQSWADKTFNELSINNASQKRPTEFAQYNVVAKAIDTRTKAQLFVIPSTRFIQDQYMNEQSANIDFVTNIIFDVATDGSLSGIKSRNISVIPLPPLSPQNKDFFKWFNILFLPVLFALVGGVALYKRR